MKTFGALLRQRLRRDRWQLIIWVLSIGLLGAFSAASLSTTYGSGAGRVELMHLAIANPAILVLRGLPQGTGLASVTFFEIYTFLALLAGLMSTFLAVRHTRAEEESGRAELVAATEAARITPTAATIAHGVIANILVAVAVGLGFMSNGLPVAGSFVAGAAVGGAGIAFLAVGLFTSQLMSTSRGANGLAAAIVVLAYFLRGIGDSIGTVKPDGVHMVSGWPTWLSPIGWGEQMDAWGGNVWWPLLLDLAFAAAVIAVVFILQSQRDTGASLLAERAGRADARPSLNGPLGLAWRLQWPIVVGWAAGGVATGILAGSLGSVVSSSIANDPTLSSMRKALASIGSGGGGSMTQIFISAIFSIVGVLSAACATQVVVRLRQEEAGGTAEVLLATPLSRIRWLLEFMLVGVIAVVVVLAAAGLAAGLSAMATGEDASIINSSFAAAAAQLPVSLIYLGVLSLVFVVLPNWSIVIAWAALGLGAFLGIFGGFIGLTDSIQKLSPFAHTPVVTGPSPDWSGGIWMIVIAIAATLVAAALIRRRDFAIA
ncbi:ABC transporter permease [Diaminobutyricibacter sp. McL0608]|uniref:ABC transporter permease n=1 Tax=Leifsonia sp. McL0608 TaxID=3143537 RepID=UPI0031F331C4